MRINTNLTAMNTYTQYTQNNSKIASAVAKLSSGSAINTAADNATGLAISEKMRAQIRGLTKAQTNAQDAISLVQTAEGALGSSTEILQRMRELAVQSASDTNEDEIDRTALQDEFSQLQKELNDIAKNTSFNKKILLDGSLAAKTANLANVSLAQSGLSVELGKAAAGDYGFSVSVQQESAAIEGKESTFTAISSSDSFTVGTAVTNYLGESSLANGNYTISASYDTANKQMVFTAAGDNNQTFTAILDQATLTSTFGSGTAATLNFKNGDDTAFSFTIDPALTYSTSNESAMTSLASELSEALSLSAVGGVDAQDATYGVYGNLTGAASVKLEAGMSSVTFANGVKVNFDKLTTSSVSTANSAALASAPALTGVATATTSTGSYTATLQNFKALDTYDTPFGDVGDTLTAVTTNFTTDKMAIVLDGNTYTASFVEADLHAALDFVAADTIGTVNTYALTFKNAAGENAFTMDVTATLTGLTNPGGTGTAAMDAGALSAASLTVALTNGGGHTYESTFGTTASSFDVVNTSNAGLTFQVGANEGDSMVINVDKMDANYLGVASASVATRTTAQSAIKAVDSAINQVSSQRAYLGAVQNRLDYKISNLETSTENLTSAESQIRDVDMAKEMTEFTNANILQQAATAMLAQANSLPQNVLSLIGK